MPFFYVHFLCTLILIPELGYEYGESNIIGSQVAFLKKEKRRLFLLKNSAIGGSSRSNKQSMALSLSSSIPGEFPTIPRSNRPSVLPLSSDLSSKSSTAEVLRTQSEGSVDRSVAKNVIMGSSDDLTALVDASLCPSAPSPVPPRQLASSPSTSPNGKLPLVAFEQHNQEEPTIPITMSSASGQPPPTNSQQTQVNIFNPREARQSTLDYRAALWAIGHIGSTELGMATILEKGK